MTVNMQIFALSVLRDLEIELELELVLPIVSLSTPFHSITPIVARRT